MNQNENHTGQNVKNQRKLLKLSELWSLAQDYVEAPVLWGTQNPF